MCQPAHRSIRCRSRWAQGTCPLPIMTITPWCSIERSGLLARETRTRKFVTRVQVMLNSAAIARPSRVSEMYRDPCRVDDAAPKVVQFLHRVREQNANPTSPLNRYIEGWAQTDLEKILDATAPSYRFTDPLVGSFDGRSLHKYFDLLQDRLSCTGAISRRDLAFFLQGPMRLGSHKKLQFWREAPRSGSPGSPRSKSENKASQPSALNTTSTWRPTYCAAPWPCTDPSRMAGETVAASTLPETD